MPIFHIAERSDWEAARATGSYTVASLQHEGFIHLSTREQFLDTASRYYRGREDLVLLEVDDAALTSGVLRYERSTGGELFPHLYAPLPLEAVIRTHMFLPDDLGGFAVPPTLG